MRMGISPDPSVNAPLVPFRHQYYALDFSFENISLYTFIYRLQSYSTDMLQGDMQSLKSKTFKNTVTVITHKIIDLFLKRAVLVPSGDAILIVSASMNITLATTTLLLLCKGTIWAFYTCKATQ